MEFALLEIVALTPKSEHRLNEFAKWYDNGIAVSGHESMSNAIGVLTKLRAIEVLISESAALRSAVAAVRPYPLQTVRLPGTVDLTQFGAQLYERGLWKRKDRPDERKFEQPLRRLGEVSGASMKAHEFEFRVWNKSSVVIRDIEVSNGCTVPDKSMFGRELAAGSVHKLPVTIRVDGSVSTQAKTLRVLTEPASPVPIVLAVAYSRRDPPQLSLNRLLVEASPETFASGEIVVTYHRHVSDPKLTLESNKSQFGDFSLIDSTQTYAEVVTNIAVNETVGSDTIRLTLRALARHPYGTRDAEMKLAFSDGSTQVIPTRIVVPHPIAVSPETIFAGMMKTGEVSEKSIRVTTPANSNSVSVSHAPGMITDSSIVSDRLTVRVVAPQQAGRYESIVTLTSGSLPPRKIPVVCVVKGE